MKVCDMANRQVLVCGNFNILHPGHIRLLNFAKECGDHLIVAVNSDSIMSVTSQVSEQQRLELVSLLDCVDEAFINYDSPTCLIEKKKPWAMVKGREFENTFNEEDAALRVYGGQLIFGSGEFGFDSGTHSHSHSLVPGHFDFTELQNYAHRHQIKLDDLFTIFDKIKSLNCAVIGEAIIDEYVQGNAVGLSQEDPTIVMTPSKSDLFLGGAAITAGHVKAMGAKSVRFFSVVGADEQASFVKKQAIDYGLLSSLYEDISRPTPLKTRFRVGSKTLLRVNKLRQHSISTTLQKTIYQELASIANEIDLLFFSDFNYGVLPQALVEKIMYLCDKNEIKVIADSQTSSQIGNISRYRNTELITPTEREVRVALNNADDGLVILANKLCEVAQPSCLAITLGEEGVFIHVPSNNYESWINDQIPALNKKAVDSAGAGDCFMASSGLCLAVGATPWQAFYIGSIAAAYQVDQLGNRPLELQVLSDIVKSSFNLY